jgi:hypothetical protein
LTAGDYDPDEDPAPNSGRIGSLWHSRDALPQRCEGTKNFARSCTKRLSNAISNMGLEVTTYRNLPQPTKPVLPNLHLLFFTLLYLTSPSFTSPTTSVALP